MHTIYGITMLYVHVFVCIYIYVCVCVLCVCVRMNVCLHLFLCGFHLGVDVGVEAVGYFLFYLIFLPSSLFLDYMYITFCIFIVDMRFI